MQLMVPIVYMLLKGKMRRIRPVRNPEAKNFVIVCSHGDWGGYRTLADCMVQFPQLEARGAEDGYFWVEER
jgi:hypothetical protein